MPTPRRAGRAKRRERPRAGEWLGGDAAAKICEARDVNRFFPIVFGVVAVLGTGMIFLQQQDIAELRTEIAELRNDAQKVAKAQQDATRASRPQQTAPATTAVDAEATSEQRAEVAKLREEVAALKKGTAQLALQAQAAVQAARGESPIPLKLTPAAELKNVGRATASDAVETLLAAAFGGDVETLANSIMLDPAAQAKAAEMFSRLPDASRAEYGSPDKLIALMLAKDAAALSGMQILGQRDVTPDIVGVRVRLATDDGKTKEQGLGFRKTSDGLRLIVTDDIVKKYAGQLSGGK